MTKNDTAWHDWHNGYYSSQFYTTWHNLKQIENTWNSLTCAAMHKCCACLRHNWIDWCIWPGPDGRLDTKINQIPLCHIFMSYAYDAYDAYDIEIWHK